MIEAIALVEGIAWGIDGVLSSIDPPLQALTTNLDVPFPTTPGHSATTATPETASLAPGQVSGNLGAGTAVASGSLTASWSSAAGSAFLATSLSAAAATVLDSQGKTVGSGMAALATPGLTPVTVSGSDQYSVNGQGSLSFYGPAESNVGVSGAWQSYSTTVTGSVSITLTVAAGVLTLGGQRLPAGTYTITTGSATLAGSGNSSSPNFAGSVSISATGGTLELGPGTGTLSVGGKPLEPDDETTLDGYNGTISVTANRDGTDAVTLSGTAGNVLQVAVPQAPFTTDQNTPISFQPAVATSLPDTYTLTATAPPGWMVTIDASGKVTATPAPGLQGGTYPIQISAQSQSDPGLQAATTVEVAITPTQPAIALAVVPETQISVAFDGAQLPTAFRATIQNLGPAADTYHLSATNIPTGFTLLQSGTSVTIPAGQTGFLGLYLQPVSGQPIPLPGTQLSFTVTATSATDPSITEMQTETFTMPVIDALAVSASPTGVSTPPGSSISDTLTITNVGNVQDINVALTDTLTTGLTLTGLAPVTLAVGQSTTETLTLAPDASVAMGSTLDAAITATYGPAGAPLTQVVDIPVTAAIPGAAAIANASVAAGQLGNAPLAERLNDLSAALANLDGDATSQVAMSQTAASLHAVIGMLSTDAYLGSAGATLTADGATLAGATTAAAVQAALAQLGTDLGTVGATLTDEAAHGIRLYLLASSQVGQPQVATTYQVVLQNNGSEPTTYDLSLMGVPSGVTASLSQTSVMLAPGAATSLPGAAIDLSVTITSTAASDVDAFTFSVQATAEGAPEISRTATGAVRSAGARSCRWCLSHPPLPPPVRAIRSTSRRRSSTPSINRARPRSRMPSSILREQPPSTSQPVAITLDAGSPPTSEDLGNLDTTHFAVGDYTITVMLTDTSGDPIPGAIGQGSLLIGSLLTAALTATPSTVAAGVATVNNTLVVSGTPFTASVEVPNNTGVAIVPNSFNVAPTQIIAGTDFDTLVWTTETTPTLTWQSTVSNLAPGEATEVTLGASVTSQGTPGTVTAPPTADPSPYSHAGTIPPPAYFVGTGSDVIAYFYGTGASYNSDVAMLVNGVMSPIGFVFPNHSTAFGTSVDLGFAPLGSTIVFELQVFGFNAVTLVNTPSPHYEGTPIYDLYSDPSLNTMDNINHIYSTGYTAAESASGGGTIPPGTYVAFEDLLYPGSDLNYNDHDFVFTDILPSTAPPVTITLAPTAVSGASILGLSPPSRTVAPAAPASYEVTLSNPTSSTVTYSLSVQGVPASWVDLPAPVAVAANAARWKYRSC